MRVLIAILGVSFVVAAQGIAPGWGTYLGSGDSGALNRVRIGLDGEGNVYFAASTGQANFRVRNGSEFVGAGSGRTSLYVAKLKATGELVWGSYMQGAGPNESLQDLAVDAGGNLYLSGTMTGGTSAQFPASGGVLFSLDTNGQRRWTRVANWLPFGNAKLVFAPGGNLVGCGWTSLNGTVPDPIASVNRTSGGGQEGVLVSFRPNGDVAFASFFGGSGSDRFDACAVDATGLVHAGFNGATAGLPSSGIAGIDLEARRIVYSAELGLGRFGPTKILAGSDYLWLAGAAGPGLITTADAEVRTGPDTSAAGRNAFLMKVSLRGSVLYGSYVGRAGSGSSGFAGLDRDAAGNIYSCGDTQGASWPLTAGALETMALGTSRMTFNRHNAQGKLDYATFLNSQSGTSECTGLVVRDGRVLLPGRSNGLMQSLVNPLLPPATASGGYHWVLTLDVQPGNRPLISAEGVTNAASFAGGAVAPGEIVTIFGDRTGPPQLAGLQLTSDRRVAKVTGNTRVLFDSTPSPMVYAVEGQVSAVVPYGVAGKSVVDVVVEYNGVQSLPVRKPVAAAAPGLFTVAGGAGLVVAILESGCCNGAERPALRGEVIVLYATGEGQTNPPGRDGSLAEYAILAEYPRPVLPVRVTIGGQEAEILYAGAAPGFLAGLMQINLRVPATAPLGDAVPVVLTVGAQSSGSGVTMVVR